MDTVSEIANQRHEAGFNCAQSVFTPFAEMLGVPLDVAAKISQPFGGGMGRSGATCGAVSGALMALGLAAGNPDPKDGAAKQHTYALARQLMERFQARHGALLCRDLLGDDISNPEGYQKIKEAGFFHDRCPAYIQQAPEILIELLAEHKIELQPLPEDWTKSHAFFAARCFNAAWDLIDKQNRTADEEQAMINLAHASLYHWSQRSDCTPQNLSIGYWQAARIYALVNQPENARRYALRSIAYAQDEPPFYLGYAYEALARAEILAGNHVAAQQALEKAQREASKVNDEESRRLLESDLATIR